MSGCDEFVRAIEMEQLNSEEDVHSKVVMKLLVTLGYPVCTYGTAFREKPSCF